MSPTSHPLTRGRQTLESSDTGGLEVKARQASWNRNAHYLMIDSVRQGGFRTYPRGLSLSKARFAEVVVYGAGHLLPMDKPQPALKMLNDFIGTEPGI
ncbi:hypothetical protein NX722_07245 [Endozoicomonas gorgoniicola]|uniref:Alpha/beta hydrolase n=1 Tax=Endozoicomonas gorgoniicola TaxID=1234144 RepID=A0ABT3MST0_9GAMM|nr:hypothetical protein [Endozoicomonas gorgoniicola]MCW7552441.1 hypothetical protein [Endozoicomonas gorgoniicola]